MKNVLNIDSTNICTCTMVSSIDDKTARVVLNIIVDVALNPRLEILNFRTIELTSTTTEIELTETEIKGSGDLKFRVVDDSKTGDYFTIVRVASLDESLYIKQESNYKYTLKVKATQYDTALSTTSENAVQNKVVTAALNNKANLPDSALSTTSTNAVQNKVVTAALNNKANKPDTALSTTSENVVQNKVVTNELNNKVDLSSFWSTTSTSTIFDSITSGVTISAFNACVSPFTITICGQANFSSGVIKNGGLLAKQKTAYNPRGVIHAPVNVTLSTTDAGSKKLQIMSTGIYYYGAATGLTRIEFCITYPRA